MATVKDEVGNVLKEGDYVVFPNQSALSRGRIESISTVLQKGPFHGGVHVKIVHEIDFVSPPGHVNAPVHLVAISEEEKAKEETRKKGLPPKSALEI